MPRCKGDRSIFRAVYYNIFVNDLTSVPILWGKEKEGKKKKKKKKEGRKQGREGRRSK